ncbi:MAG TPA: hypothetical protein VFF09_00505 [archaeon]|nr:hypothetical protein [archaeon]
MAEMSRVICPKCGSKSLEKTLSKGFQFRCRKCGFEGQAVSDVF